MPFLDSSALRFAKVMDLEVLVKEFADGVVGQSEATDKGDARESTKFARQYVAAFEKLRALGDAGRNALVPLLSDGRVNVRVMAAAFLLRHCEERAKAVLEAEALGKGIIAFGAEQALLRWKEGTWALDPE